MTDDLTARRVRKLLNGPITEPSAESAHPSETLARYRKAVRMAFAADALARLDPSRKWSLEQILAAAGYAGASSETLRVTTELLGELAEVISRAVEVGRKSPDQRG